jgi:hypothetical protein
MEGVPMTIDSPGGPGTAQPPSVKPKLLHLVRQAIRIRHYSPRTEEAYVHWIRRYIFFHQVRHPAEMGKLEHSAAPPQPNATEPRVES